MAHSMLLILFQVGYSILLLNHLSSYKETKNPPFDSQNKPAFKKGRTWITADRTGHNGGRWKMFNSKGTRIATCDKNLNFIKD